MLFSKTSRYSLYESGHYSSVKELLNIAAKLHGDKVAYRELDKNKNFVDRTFIQTRNEVNALGTKLLKMGLKGAHISVMSENRYAWALTYLTVINGVGVIVPLDKELLDDDVVLQLNKSDCEVIVCSSTYLPMMERVMARCPDIKFIICMDRQESRDRIYSMKQLIDEGFELVRHGNNDYINMRIDADAMTEIIFTSGTTGANKGVMLTHRNLCHVIHGSFALIKSTSKHMSVLPLSHAYECTENVLGILHCGTTLCFCDNIRHVNECLNIYKPDLVLVVPLILETMQKTIQIETKRNGLQNHFNKGIFWSRILRKFGIDMRKKFFKPILDRFGGNIEQIVCGGAPLHRETAEFFDAIGLKIVNGYGISECAPLLSANSTAWSVEGSVGRVIPGTDIRIYNPNSEGIGEIHVKGPNVMLGYYKDPVATAKTFTPDGWFDTGDLGYLKNHMLYITGRKKNLIILANSKNVFPEELEEYITRDIPYVKEVVVYANCCEEGKEASLICAAVYLDADYLAERGIEDPEKLINADMKKLNGKLPVYKRINKVVVRDSEFIKTTTQKIKRHTVSNA